MISDEEKARILERVRLENQIKKEITDSEEKEGKKTKWSFLQSKLGLLVIGSFITGILVPLFQFTQETIKWTRQNRYDNVKHHLEMIRSGMKELTAVQPFVAEAYERARPLIESKMDDQKRLDQYRIEIADMQYRRYLQNAKFVMSLVYFPEREREAIRQSFNIYLSSVEAFMSLLNSTVSSMENKSPEFNEKQKNTFKQRAGILSKDINDNYDEVVRILKRYLGSIEHESEKYM